MEHEPRIIRATIELPVDGSLHSIRIYVKAEDEENLSAQAILDAVSDALIDCIDVFEGSEEYEPIYDA